MRILFFDTETNGLPKNMYAAADDLANWPRVLQIAWELWDLPPTLKMTQLTDACFLVKPEESLEWDKDSEKIHGITKERALAEGMPGPLVFGQFRAVLEQAHIVVAHNLGFDKPVVIAECIRNTKGTLFWDKLEYCTCMSNIELCKLPVSNPKSGGSKYKRPRLGELFKFLYGREPNVALHNAAADTEILRQCFQGLLARRLVPLEEWQERLRV